MKILVIGLGSMGQRRIRNMQEIGNIEIAGFDLRLDRRENAGNEYLISTYATLDEAMSQFKPNAFVISTSPSHHMNYAHYAAEKEIHCFIEASVTDAARILELSLKISGKKIIMAPSCTMKYFPGPKKIKELLESRAIGKPLVVNYQTGQYLPDWHPWEKIQDYYVSVRETGGAREIVPFELTWLNPLFGDPKPKHCLKKKLSNLEADIDDFYQFTLEYSTGVVANFQIEVLSRPVATRELRIIGTEGQLVLSSDSNTVRIINTAENVWKSYSLGTGTVQEGYINPEEPYIEEMSDFVRAIRELDQNLFQNNLMLDYKILQLLGQIEELAIESK
jgi:predicted dehydrogenase